MRGYFGLGQLSAEEKSDILDKHRHVYDGYRTMQPEVSNQQPLYVHDFAGDKEGMVVNNKGEVKRYTNMGINEQVESKDMCEQCGGQMDEGICEQCGTDGEMREAVGKLDDIYDEEDLNPTAGFDYIEGSSNDDDTFEKMHKNLYKEQDVEDTDNEDDGYEDMNASEVTDEIKEQGGNADDMNVSDVAPAYDFDSNGPMGGGDVYPVHELDFDDEDTNNPDYEPMTEDDMYGYEPEMMESAWAEEMDEVDISGSQGIYGDMEKAYDFDSDGPGKGGPYQEFSYEGETDEQFLPGHMWKHMKRRQDAEKSGEDFDVDEFDPSDYEGLDAKNSSWEEIKSYFGNTDWDEVDEELQESFHIQKNKIMEMFNRVNKYN